jgi:hypothetical protein
MRSTRWTSVVVLHDFSYFPEEWWWLLWSMARLTGDVSIGEAIEVGVCRW